MKDIRTTLLVALLFIGITSLSTGCVSTPSLSGHPDFFIPFEGNPASPKSIFVFLDGTANDASSETNVWRLFNQLKRHKNQQTIGYYIPGVGSIEEPLEDDLFFKVFGDALGKGMQARILEGYDFISEHYRPGDEMFIFGFSRGAHQARALAGFIAYSGMPAHVSGNKNERKNKYERILEQLKDIRDEDRKGEWKAWSPNQTPLLANDIKNDMNLAMHPAEIKFVGVWDAVPGSSFKNYEQNPCKEDIGIVKTYLHWIPGISKGERYKSDSYPPIRHIAHAVSLDEKRSKFAPLYLCGAIPSNHPTNIKETWFPGAHADVGGGYGDHALPNISLNWMIHLLGEHYQFSSKIDEIVKENTEDSKGLAHWSYGDPRANTGSECEDRRGHNNRQPPIEYDPHPSIDERTKAGVVPIMIKGKTVNKDKNDKEYGVWRYPILCPGPGK